MLYILSKRVKTRKPYTVHKVYEMRRSSGYSKVVAPTT